MILGRNDAIAPPESIRSAYARAGEPKRLLEIDGGHYAVYTDRVSMKRDRPQWSGSPNT